MPTDLSMKERARTPVRTAATISRGPIDRQLRT